MRIYLMCITCAFCFILPGKAQNNNAIKDTIHDKNEFYKLLALCDYYYKTGKSDSMLTSSNSLIETSSYLKNDSFLTTSYRLNGNYYFLKNDYTKAIEKYLEGIKIAENNSKIAHLLPQLYNNIGFNYNMLNYHDLAMQYLKKGELVAKEKNNNRSLAYLYENIAFLFANMNEPDSSSYYLKNSEEANRQFSTEPNFKSKDSNYIRASIYIDYGRLYALYYYRDSLNKYSSIANSSFLSAIHFSDTTTDFKHLASAYYEYGLYFLKTNRLDSCEKYALKSYTLSTDYKYIDLIIKNADLLQERFELEKKSVEAYQYLKLKNTYSDSLSKLNQNNEILDLTFRETLREKLEEEKKVEAEKQRANYIEFSLIALAIFSFGIIFLALTRTFIVNAAFIKFVGQIGLLIFFEFINLLIHPFIEEKTHHSNLLMLLIMVVIASALIPIHHKLEKYVRTQLVEKNKKIRETMAKKILKGAKHITKHTHNN